MYADFEVRIYEGTAPGPYRVQVVNSPASEADGAMLLADGLDELIAKLRQDYPDLETRQAFGTKLFRALFSGEIGRVWYESKGLSRGRREDGLRLLLRVDDPFLARLPWELLNDGRSFLATKSDLPLSRYLSTGDEPPAFDDAAELRVLAVLESPADLPPISQEFRQAFASSLEDLEANGVNSRVLDNASLSDIHSALQDGYHVLHLVAHGSDSGQIALVGDDHTTMRRINDTEFAQLFEGRRVRLVVLSACGSAEGAGGGLFSGVGPSLIRSGVPAVVAMQYPFVRQISAGVFNTAFYKALAKSRPVDVAVNEGRQLLSSDQTLDQRDWSTPVLFMGTRSGQIISLAKGAVRPQTPPAIEAIAREASPITKNIIILIPFEPDGTADRNGMFKLIYRRLKYIIEKKINVVPPAVGGRKYQFKVDAALAVTGRLSSDALVAIRDTDIVIGYVSDLNATIVYELAVRSLLRAELLLVVDGDSNTPPLSWIREMDWMPLTPSWMDDAAMKGLAGQGDSEPLDAFDEGITPGQLSRLAAYSDISDRQVESGLRRALLRILDGKSARPNYVVRVMEELDPESLVSGSSFYYPAALLKYTWLPRKRDRVQRYLPYTEADLSEPPVICDWNPQFLELFNLELLRPDADGPLTDEDLQPFLMDNMDPEDYANYRQAQKKLIESTVLGLQAGVAQVPIRFNFKHPETWYRNRSFLPCFVMKKKLGSPDMTHYLYILMIFFDVTGTTDYNVYHFDTPKEGDRPAH